MECWRCRFYLRRGVDFFGDRGWDRGLDVKFCVTVGCQELVCEGVGEGWVLGGGCTSLGGDARSLFVR